MVHRKILKELGWSKALIDEVTRSAEQITANTPSIDPGIRGLSEDSSVSGTSLQINPGVVASNTLFFSAEKK